MQKFKPNNTKKSANSRTGRQTVQHGLPTPEATPEVDEARINTEETRRQQEGDLAARNKSSTFSTSKPPPPSVSDYESGDDTSEYTIRNTPAKSIKKEELNTLNAPDKDKDTSKKTKIARKKELSQINSEKTIRDKENKKDWTEKQDKVVNEVIKARFNYQILGIRPGPDTGEARTAWKKRALELHPDKNKNPKAKEAFKSK